MPRLVHINPSYRKHRASGHAIVSIAGRDFYLGPWKSKASLAEYDRVIGEWLAAGRRLPGLNTPDITVSEVIDRFWQHAQDYYRHADGTPTSEVGNLKSPLKASRTDNLSKLSASVQVHEVSPWHNPSRPCEWRPFAENP
jgi:hypothetical protein